MWHFDVSDLRQRAFTYDVLSCMYSPLSCWSVRTDNNFMYSFQRCKSTLMTCNNSFNQRGVQHHRVSSHYSSSRSRPCLRGTAKPQNIPYMYTARRRYPKVAFDGGQCLPLSNMLAYCRVNLYSLKLTALFNELLPSPEPYSVFSCWWTVCVCVCWLL